VETPHDRPARKKQTPAVSGRSVSDDDATQFSRFFALRFFAAPSPRRKTLRTNTPQNAALVPRKKKADAGGFQSTNAEAARQRTGQGPLRRSRKRRKTRTVTPQKNAARKTRRKTRTVTPQNKTQTNADQIGQSALIHAKAVYALILPAQKYRNFYINRMQIAGSVRCLHRSMHFVIATSAVEACSKSVKTRALLISSIEKSCSSTFSSFLKTLLGTACGFLDTACGTACRSRFAALRGVFAMPLRAVFSTLRAALRAAPASRRCAAFHCLLRAVFSTLRAALRAAPAARRCAAFHCLLRAGFSTLRAALRAAPAARRCAAFHCLLRAGFSPDAAR
jgi:uncharacterized protein (DUF2267 family)